MVPKRLDDHGLDPGPCRAVLTDQPADLQVAAASTVCVLDRSEQRAGRDHQSSEGQRSAGPPPAPLTRPSARDLGASHAPTDWAPRHPDDRDPTAADLDVQGVRSGGEL